MTCEDTQLWLSGSLPRVGTLHEAGGRVRGGSAPLPAQGCRDAGGRAGRREPRPQTLTVRTPEEGHSGRRRPRELYSETGREGSVRSLGEMAGHWGQER